MAFPDRFPNIGNDSHTVWWSGASSLQLLSRAFPAVAHTFRSQRSCAEEQKEEKVLGRQRRVWCCRAAGTSGSGAGLKRQPQLPGAVASLTE